MIVHNINNNISTIRFVIVQFSVLGPIGEYLDFILSFSTFVRYFFHGRWCTNPCFDFS